MGLPGPGLLGFGVFNALGRVGPDLDLLTSGRAGLGRVSICIYLKLGQRAGFCRVGTGWPALGYPDIYIYIYVYIHIKEIETTMSRLGEEIVALAAEVVAHHLQAGSPRPWWPYGG